MAIIHEKHAIPIVSNENGMLLPRKYKEPIKTNTSPNINQEKIVKNLRIVSIAMPFNSPDKF